MNKKTMPSIESHVVGDQNDIWVVGLCRFVSEEFEDNDHTLIALNCSKINKKNEFK